ncbi:DNA polymerase subunit Cdc27, partial [Mycena galopus ATCC 62051]
AIRDYLTKQLLIEKNIVTYRSLSRVLSLNVNVAKNELAEFHANDGQGLAATYLLSGQTQPKNTCHNRDCLVGERELESAQAEFIALDSIHVYSLSPSVIRDSGLLCTPTEIVRNLDSKKGSELASIVGKVIGADVNLSNNKSSWGGRKAPAPVAGPSKATATAASAVKKAEEAKPKEKEKAKPEKPKVTGKLDFSKAKTKPLKKEEEKSNKAETKGKGKEKEKEKSTLQTSTKMDESKVLCPESDSDEEEEKVVAKPAKPAKPVAQTKSSVHVRKNVILEKDLHAMMDIDDDAVTHEPMEEVIDVDMADKDTKPAPVKRKPKKVVPVGKNGLKKKRIVKSRSRIDEKGYMVMEDFSEYESVDEEEPAPAPKVKKTKSADAAPAKAKPAPKPAPAPAKAKSKASGGPTKSGQPTVASFFGKSKSK